jgi:hypothetical protein
VLTDCVLVGYSIALGIAAALAAAGPHACEPFARKGAGTAEIRSLVPSGRHEVAIVSAGTNDSADPALRDNLKRLRAALRARRVVWTYPRSPRSAWAVYETARSFGDAAIGLRLLASDDDVHPREYRAAARLITAWV